MVSIKEMLNRMDVIDDKIIIGELEEHELWVKSLGNDGKKLILDEVDLRNIDMKKNSLDQSFVVECIFDGMDLSNKDIYASTLCSSTFRHSTLNNTKFSKSDLMYVDFTGAEIKNANFHRCDCGEAIFIEANLSNSLLSTSGFYDTDFTRAILSNVDIRYSTFNNVLVGGADLRGLKGISEANIKSINIGTKENPIIITGEDAVLWLQAKARS